MTASGVGGALTTPPVRCQGGAGARVSGTMAVTPGQRFYVEVGGAGGDAQLVGIAGSSQTLRTA